MNSLKDFLDRKVDEYNRPEFIDGDPICIPHRFTRKQDIEIMGFFAAVLAWGQRKTIINKCMELIDRMDGEPFDFVTGHSELDLKQLEGFKHRTFNDTDLLYFVRFFRDHYSRDLSLETAFVPAGAQSEFRSEYLDDFMAGAGDASLSSPACYLGKLHGNGREVDMTSTLNHFQSYFFSLPEHPARTRKHISSPARNSACKRLNMFLRWMVRRDNCGVDFGLWNQFKPSQLVCPCDVHVERVARKLGLIQRKQSDWKTACELTDNLRRLDATDPVKYDFALFGLGVAGEL
ncbi:TIGR02757 family protein [Parapedobacter soli]|uniref:TIGR02757 family protein n=1 Tax=Parapedobacter soli TaxID=416955 RepID=UPI0021C63A2E|nr:TIGR02757 family protein [Parapedobacter soli]